MAGTGVAIALIVVAVVVAALAVAARRGRVGPSGTAALVGGLVAAACLAGAGAVFAVVASDDALESTDGPVLGWVLAHRDPVRTEVASAVSLVGGTVVTGGVAVVAAVVLLVCRRRVAALVWVVAVAVGALAIRLLKLAVERPRPPVDARLAVETSASLPSGHSLMAALGLGLAASAVVAFGPARPRGLRPVVVVAAVLAVAAIGASRAYLGVHWTTDVLAGWLLGGALAALATTVAVVMEARRVAPGPPAPTSPRRSVRNAPFDRPIWRD